MAPHQLTVSKPLPYSNGHNVRVCNQHTWQACEQRRQTLHEERGLLFQKTVLGSQLLSACLHIAAIPNIQSA